MQLPADQMLKTYQTTRCVSLKVVSSAGSHFGSTKADLLGGSIPITAVLADQVVHHHHHHHQFITIVVIIIKITINIITIVVIVIKITIVIIIIFIIVVGLLLWVWLLHKWLSQDHHGNWLLFR